jgi:hypothetical protein
MEVEAKILRGTHSRKRYKQKKEEREQAQSGNIFSSLLVPFLKGGILGKGQT